MENKNNRNGINFIEALTIAFIVLKLIGKISWPWIWVISPLWIGAGLSIIALIIAYIYAKKTGNNITFHI